MAAQKDLGMDEGFPPGISLADNETGWQIALDKLRHSSKRATEFLSSG